MIRYSLFEFACVHGVICLLFCFKAAKKEKQEKKTRMDKYEEEKDSGVRAAHELFMKHKCCWCVHKAAVLIRSVTYPFTVWCGLCCCLGLCLRLHVCIWIFEFLVFCKNSKKWDMSSVAILNNLQVRQFLLGRFFFFFVCLHMIKGNFLEITFFPWNKAAVFAAM